MVSVSEMTNIEAWLEANGFECIRANSNEKAYSNGAATVYLDMMNEAYEVDVPISLALCSGLDEEGINRVAERAIQRIGDAQSIMLKLREIGDPWDKIDPCVICDCCYREIKPGDSFWEIGGKAGKVFCSENCYVFYSRLTKRTLDKKALGEMIEKEKGK